MLDVVSSVSQDLKPVSPGLTLYLYLNTVDLQNHVSFRCIAQQFKHTYIYRIYIYVILQILFSYRLLQNTE